MNRRIMRAMLAVAFGVGVSAFGMLAAKAQPVRDRILSKVEVAEEVGCATVKVSLNFPARYISHFPLETGDEVRIKLRPIEISRDDVRGLLRRESLRAPDSELAAISASAGPPSAPSRRPHLSPSDASPVPSSSDVPSISIRPSNPVRSSSRSVRPQRTSVPASVVLVT